MCPLVLCKYSWYEAVEVGIIVRCLETHRDDIWIFVSVKNNSRVILLSLWMWNLQLYIINTRMHYIKNSS